MTVEGKLTRRDDFLQDLWLISIEHIQGFFVLFFKKLQLGMYLSGNMLA